MIPVKYLEDLKTAPIHEVDFVGTFIEVRIKFRKYSLLFKFLSTNELE
jgi:hypothetical protein